MSTPPQPSFMACAVSRTESGRAQQPVPGIIREGSTPALTSRSSSSIFSSVESEFASELVPKTASPTFWLRSQRHCLAKRSGSGERSGLKGVTTGERTPVMRSLVLTVEAPWLGGCWRPPIVPPPPRVRPDAHPRARLELRGRPARVLRQIAEGGGRPREHRPRGGGRSLTDGIEVVTEQPPTQMRVLGKIGHHRFEREIAIGEMEDEKPAHTQHVEIEAQRFSGEEVHRDGVGAEGVHHDDVVALLRPLLPHLLHANAGVAHLDPHGDASVDGV